MKIYLIRHGQTDWNVAGKIQGRTDIPLNDTGRRQAQCLARGMEKRLVVQVFTSTLKRAEETARVIAQSQQIDVEPIPDLQEIGFGCWEGLTLKEIQQQYPKEYERWCINPVTVAPPGGELQAEIRQRCCRVMERIQKQAKGDFAIVSHGAMLAYIVEYLMREHPLEEEIIVENASITTIQYQELTQDFLLLQSNDTAHLRKDGEK